MADAFAEGAEAAWEPAGFFTEGGEPYARENPLIDARNARTTPIPGGAHSPADVRILQYFLFLFSSIIFARAATIKRTWNATISNQE